MKTYEWRMMMTLARYEVFYTVVESGSLTKAGQILNLTQSGISQAITSLETELGFSLLTRGRGGIQLTSNGERMLSYVRDILFLYEGMKQEAAAINGIEMGVVRIGTFTSVASQWLPDIIKLFEEDHPGIELQLYEGDYASIEQWISTGEVDCGFLTLPTPKSLEFTPLKKDRMLCILSDQHPLQNKDNISFKEIENERLIIPKLGWDHEVREIFKENNINPQIKFEVSEDEIIIAMVKNNLGISIRPEMTLSSLPSCMRILNLEKESFRYIGIATKPNTSPATRKFVDCVYSWLKSNHLLDS
ncbi:LysR family transcriptional regulator [Alkalihalobacillus sp. MEB130]|uniref:LysR family transcriptional regulator n=1 Tax=Alkalihalobacillus sp. MEB130 TaxID=2976704 RepID=UPI0028DE146B|nr:LysR family transcriptional regulator [Alkalihalobacillus sp. MEB130]MDT8860690.1 LysR family transcriptional regulator [Alkalihalobacillus sp. MEB130]